MADTKDYLVQQQENGSILISAEVVASIAANAVREVEGVYGLSLTSTLDLSAILGKKNLRKGMSVTIDGDQIEIGCNLIVRLGETVMTVAKNVQDSIAGEVEAMTGIRPTKVNVHVCGVAAPKEAKK